MVNNGSTGDFALMLHRFFCRSVGFINRLADSPLLGVGLGGPEHGLLLGPGRLLVPRRRRRHDGLAEGVAFVAALAGHALDERRVRVLGHP